MFQKVDKKVFKVHTDTVNKVIKYLKSKSITEKKIIKVASICAAERIGLKKA